MHAAFLTRYFNTGRWTHDLFIALLTHRSEWTWAELSKVFCNVCHDLDGPRGSASLRVEWINHFQRLGYCRFHNDSKCDDSGETVIKAASLPKAAKRSLLAAIRWSEKRNQVNADYKAATSKAWEVLGTEGDWTDVKSEALALVTKERKRRNRRLGQLGRFKLAGRKYE